MSEINFEKDQAEVLDRTENIKSLAVDNKELVIENKQLKETFHKDKEKKKELELVVKTSIEKNIKLRKVNKILKEDNDQVQVIRKTLIDALHTAKVNSELTEHWRKKYYNKNPIQALTSWLIKNDDDGMGLTPIND